jgi:hypothetical protein
MAAKRESASLSGVEPKKQPSVLTLQETRAVFRLLRGGMSVWNVAPEYGHNIIYGYITGYKQK